MEQALAGRGATDVLGQLQHRHGRRLTTPSPCDRDDHARGGRSPPPQPQRRSRRQHQSPSNSAAKRSNNTIGRRQAPLIESGRRLTRRSSAAHADCSRSVVARRGSMPYGVSPSDRGLRCRYCCPTATVPRVGPQHRSGRHVRRRASCELVPHGRPPSDHHPHFKDLVSQVVQYEAMVTAERCHEGRRIRVSVQRQRSNWSPAAYPSVRASSACAAASGKPGPAVAASSADASSGVKRRSAVRNSAS